MITIHPNKDKLKLKVGVIVTYVALLLIAGFASVVSNYVIKRSRINDNQTSTLGTVLEKPSSYPDYDAIKGHNPDPAIKTAKLTADCEPNGCLNESPASKDFDGIEKLFLIKGKFSRAYLYIEAAVDHNRPLTIYDALYFTIDNWGGHLLSNENLLPVPPSDISKYLYDLRSISYSSGKKVFNNINFFALMQNGITLDIHASVSSDRPGRVLKEVSIYYQCAEASNCAVDEIKDK